MLVMFFEVYRRRCGDDENTVQPKERPDNEGVENEEEDSVSVFSVSIKIMPSLDVFL